MQKTGLKTIVERNDEKHFLFPQKIVKCYTVTIINISLYGCEPKYIGAVVGLQSNIWTNK